METGDDIIKYMLSTTVEVHRCRQNNSQIPTVVGAQKLHLKKGIDLRMHWQIDAF